MSVLSDVIENKQMTKIIDGFTRLGDKSYLDNAGAAQYPKALLDSYHEDLSNNLYMNPHTDKYTKDCIDQIRMTILRHFNTDSSNYSVIFTSGTTQSLKLTVESFHFASGRNKILNTGSFVYLQDNHTSVLGLRELAKEQNADIIHIPHDEFLDALSQKNMPTWNDTYKNEGNTLVAYPAQSNFNGYKYPINCVANIKNGCLNNYIRKHLNRVNCNWHVLLDAASYVSTNKLDLTKSQPDFVCLSFYKIFGFPTGLGALLVKKSCEDILSRKKYFGGGTVDVVISSENFHVKRQDISERFEDGTVAFLSILALKHCFSSLYNLIPKTLNHDTMETISFHTFHLAKDLYDQFKNLHHPNGKAAIILYNDSEFDDISKQGAIVTFNLLRPDGTYIGYAEFQHMADLFNITIRTGCFCNTGSCQRHLKLSNEEIKDMYGAGHKCGDEVDLLFGKPTGCIRVSFGYYNTYKDVDRLIEMICKCFVKTIIIKPNRTMRIKTNGTYKELDLDTKDGSDTYRYYENNYITKIKVSPLQYQITDNVILTEIVIYPIKSCGAFKINSSWKISSKGFLYDRDWMVVNDNGVALTQKQNTRMCMICPKIDFKNRLLILNFKGKDPISVPLDITNSKRETSSLCKSKVCTDTVQIYDCGDDAANWISEALEVSFLRLVRQANDDVRTLKSKKHNKHSSLLSLSNQAQYLLINKATVRWLRDKIQDDSFNDNLDNLTDRFRGNLIIDTDKELIEKDWQGITIGKHEFKVEGLCSRCQMICIDQQTGQKTVEPLRTISEQFHGKMRFGIYLSYVGTIDESADSILKNNSIIKPINNEDDISR